MENHGCILRLASVNNRRAIGDQPRNSANRKGPHPPIACLEDLMKDGLGASRVHEPLRLMGLVAAGCGACVLDP